MLLDVTSCRVQKDVHGGKLLLERVRSVWMFAGKKDHVVPMKCIQDVYDAVQANEKNFVEILNAGTCNVQIRAIDRCLGYDYPGVS